MEAPDPIFVTVNEAKRLLSLGHTRVYQLINSGQLERVKHGSKTLIPYASVKRFADSLSKAA
jgi:excisionase family DNA binding protein